MEELIYIGVPYVRGVRMKDGSEFENTPSVILFNPIAKEWFEADIEDGEDNALVATFPAELTALMQPGMYTLEIYANDGNGNHTDLLKRVEKYAKAVVVASSPNQHEVEPQQSQQA